MGIDDYLAEQRLQLNNPHEPLSTTRMQNFEIIIIIFSILIGLLAIADRLKLPNPVLLVMVGLSLGFIPALPAINLDPDVVFLLFLPPILYDAASQTSWHDFKTEIRPISTLAITLVFLTTTAVATACYLFIPGFTWPLAFVLGAIVSPPDAVAATSITKGLGLNKKVITILQGESLVNDASALIAYRFAIAAIATGSFVFYEAGLAFLILVSGGILAGTVIGYIFIQIHKKIQDNSIISTSLTLLTPFVSYLIAEHIHTSGVLAVVSTGLLISWRGPEIFSNRTRIRNSAVWDTVIFLLNGFIFIVIGLQLPSILNDLEEYRMSALIGYGLLVAGVTIAVRIIWVFGASFSFLRSNRTKSSPHRDSDTWKNVLIVAWTGTRGVVSLATALALPLSFGNGGAFPLRSLILFLAFVVIFVTLVVQGLSLPLLIRILGVKRHKGFADEERELRLLMATNVVAFIEHELSDALDEQSRMQMKRRYTDIIHLLSTELKEHSSSRSEAIGSAVLTRTSAQNDINQFQRQMLINFHKSGTFNQAIIRRLEQELDHEDVQLSRLATAQS
jgi:CPA1 family monovalent cation:H+ antiporter